MTSTQLLHSRQLTLQRVTARDRLRRLGASHRTTLARRLPSRLRGEHARRPRSAALLCSGCPGSAGHATHWHSSRHATQNRSRDHVLRPASASEPVRGTSSAPWKRLRRRALCPDARAARRSDTRRRSSGEQPLRRPCCGASANRAAGHRARRPVVHSSARNLRARRSAARLGAPTEQSRRHILLTVPQ